LHLLVVGVIVDRNSLVTQHPLDTTNLCSSLLNAINDTRRDIGGAVDRSLLQMMCKCPAIRRQELFLVADVIIGELVHAFPVLASPEGLKTTSSIAYCGANQYS